MLIKKIVVFITLFILSCTIIFLFNTNYSNGELYESYLHTEYKINKNEALNIKYSYNSDKKDKTSDENILKERIRIIESEELINSVKIYKVNLYDLNNKNNEIIKENNTIIIDDYLGPVSVFRSMSFISNLQFDYSYFKSIPHEIYEIHIPKEMVVNINYNQ